MNKKGVDILSSQVIFIILNVIFFSVLLIFVAKAGTGVGVKEEIYSKQIALMIDQAKQGTELTVDISELYEIAEKNEYTGRIINIDYQKNKISVNLGGNGYEYHYFTNLKSGSVSIDEQNKLLRIKV